MKYTHVYIILIRPTDFDGWGKSDYQIHGNRAYTDIDEASAELKAELERRRQSSTGGWYWSGYVKDLILPE